MSALAHSKCLRNLRKMSRIELIQEQEYTRRKSFKRLKSFSEQKSNRPHCKRYLSFGKREAQNPVMALRI